MQNLSPMDIAGSDIMMLENLMMLYGIISQERDK